MAELPATLDETTARMASAIAAERRKRPTTEAGWKARAAELYRLTQIAADAERRMIDRTAGQLIPSGNGANGHAVGEGEGFTQKEIDGIAAGLAAFLRGSPIAGKFRQVSVWDDRGHYDSGATVMCDGHRW